MRSRNLLRLALGGSGTRGYSPRHNPHNVNLASTRVLCFIFVFGF